MPEYRWCKVFFEPEKVSDQNFYFMHFDTQEFKYEEPNEPYWTWDSLLKNVHSCGLQDPEAEPRTYSLNGLSQRICKLIVLRHTISHSCTIK